MRPFRFGGTGALPGKQPYASDLPNDAVSRGRASPTQHRHDGVAANNYAIGCQKRWHHGHTSVVGSSFVSCDKIDNVRAVKAFEECGGVST
jgi:hypothetical protein